MGELKMLSATINVNLGNNHKLLTDTHSHKCVHQSFSAMPFLIGVLGQWWEIQTAGS
jgi:hypothetical protein